MTMFNSLGYVQKLLNAGVSRDQAEVQAQELQEILQQDQEQFATKADLIVVHQEVKEQIHQLEVKTDRLEMKTDRLQMKTGQLEKKIDHLEIKTDHLDRKISSMTVEIIGLKTTMDACKSEFSGLRADVAVLTNSHKYVLWIGGGLATVCFSVFGLCVSILLPSVR